MSQSKQLVQKSADQAVKTVAKHTAKDLISPPDVGHNHLSDCGESLGISLIVDSVLDPQKRTRAIKITQDTLSHTGDSLANICGSALAAYVGAIVTPVTLLSGNPEGAGECLKSTVGLAAKTATSTIRGGLGLICGTLDLAANALGVETKAQDNFHRNFDRIEENLGIGGSILDPLKS